MTSQATQMNGEWSPLLTTGMEVGSLHMEVACAHSLWSQPVEQSHFGARGDTHLGKSVWEVSRKEMLSSWIYIICPLHPSFCILLWGKSGEGTFTEFSLDHMSFGCSQYFTRSTIMTTATLLKNCSTFTTGNQLVIYTWYKTRASKQLHCQVYTGFSG